VRSCWSKGNVCAGEDAPGINIKLSHLHIKTNRERRNGGSTSSKAEHEMTSKRKPKPYTIQHKGFI